MSTFRLAARGVIWMLGAQLITSIGQFLYGAVTARAFSPTEFGGFAASLSLTGLLTLLTTTGFPSYILMTRSLSRSTANRVRLWALVGGVLASGLFFVALPAWLSALHAESGSTFGPYLCVSQALTPIAAVESAVLRREGRSRADAAALLSAFLLSNGAGALAILIRKADWELALPAVLYPVVLLIVSMALRARTLPKVPNEASTNMFRFSGRITMQNVGFYILQQIPGWFVSGTLGAQGLGFYTRAGTLAGMPATALSQAINRAMQPHWRKLEMSPSPDRAIKDVAVLASSLAFFLFGLLAAYGSKITDLWLGPGWAPAGHLVTLLAIAYGLSVPFTIVANSAEMRGLFRPVRLAQLNMALCLVPALLLLAWTADLFWAGLAMATSQVAALTSLILFLPWATKTGRKQTLFAIGRQALWAITLCGSGWTISYLVSFIGTSNDGYSNFLQIVTGCLTSIVAYIFLLRWNEVATILQQRGLKIPLLPKRVAQI